MRSPSPDGEGFYVSSSVSESSISRSSAVEMDEILAIALRNRYRRSRVAEDLPHPERLSDTRRHASASQEAQDVRLSVL